MDFFTSDLHLGHANIIKHDRRPFNSIEEHDEALINNWNSLVTNKDSVFVLGDIAFGNTIETENKLARLNGGIYLIRGNHDPNNVEHRCASRFTWVKDMYMYRGFLNGEKIRIVLCHYPMLRWERSHHGVWHLHGHCHGSLPDSERLRIDIGTMNHNFRPVSLEGVVDLFKEKVNRGCGPAFHHDGMNDE